MTIKHSFLAVVTFSALVLILCYGYYRNELRTPLTIPEDGLVVEIKPGDPLNTVLSSLSDAGVLQSVWVAKLYAKEQQLANKVQVGEFRLLSGLTVPELFSLLTSGKQIEYSIRFVEGSTFAQAQEQLSGHPRLVHLLAGKSNVEVLSALSVAPDLSTVHPEGLIYPDTYYFHKNDSDLSILSRAHQRLVEILRDEWANRESGLPLASPYEALILASIVEKETGVPEERAQIAGVFTRRLQLGMRLQTDPTVIYGLADQYQGNITRKHLELNTPYNTYLVAGLPPTPIALTGRAAIHAALHPEPGTTLYFVAKGDGSHEFSATLEEHNRAVQQYQLVRKPDYRSSQPAVNGEVN